MAKNYSFTGHPLSSIIIFYFGLLLLADDEPAEVMRRMLCHILRLDSHWWLYHSDVVLV